MPYTLRRAFAQWWRRHRAQRGFFGAIPRCSADLWEFARDSTPARRRARYGDVEFDCDFRVNTTAAGQGFPTRLRAFLAGAPYQPTEPALFREMMAALPISHPQFTFLDIGSGKGRALLLAADYPFRKIIGLELLPELHRIAERNLAVYQSPAQRCFHIESQCGDALSFEIPSRPLVIYLFNPLPAPALAGFLARLEQSLQREPRPAWVLYHNPEHEHLFAANSMLLKKISGTHQYSVFAAQSSC